MSGTDDVNLYAIYILLVQLVEEGLRLYLDQFFSGTKSHRCFDPNKAL